MQTASHLAREALKELIAAMDRYEIAADCDTPKEHSDMMDRATAALAALSEQSGDGYSEWLREFADTAVRSGPEHFRKQLHAIADRHDRLRERVKVLEGAIKKLHPCGVRHLSGGDSIWCVGGADDAIEIRDQLVIADDSASTSLPPAAPQ